MELGGSADTCIGSTQGEASDHATTCAWLAKRSIAVILVRDIAWLVSLTMPSMSQPECLIAERLHEPAHRFSDVSYRGIPWNLNHLDAFTFKTDLGLGGDITVLVLFSCHCFTHSFRWDARPTDLIPDDEIYDHGKERRVLDPQRYKLSRRYLREIVIQLPSRRITVANENQPNFVTLENMNEDGTTTLYAVFFEAERDRIRKRRMVLRIQSAYVLDKGLTKRQEKAGKIGFATLLRAAYLGKKVRR
ncbi:hypothetical protein [Paraburkholderia sp. C35]|uniref:hypothetical protein n=1 Tax=Paraburkholderia sp. C35 TaxID=2126993 RepID=UPI001EF6D70D|nr:hypothetical protein [Paraburkholderia sp. C35]